MKTLKNYLAYCAVLALLLTGCSKEESSVMDSPDNTSAKSVDITFGTVLNDLANRAMSRSHFDQIPDCSMEAPAYAELEISYAGQAPETTGPIQVDILSDEEGLFTTYSELLKVPVPNNSSVTVTLESFKVFDSNDNLIWIAPIESEAGEFDGYVDTALPFDFEVSDGAKPYIDVEVLCFDRRMVNEYGYVFFDILPETIYPLCLFVNYCTEAGRHYVADYSVDLYFGTDANGIQLYDHENDNAMASTGDYGIGNYYADPLCLVVPGPPANLAGDQPYLYLIIYPESWDGTGEIDETPISVALTWDMVNGYLNPDGTTNEYHHVLIGECEGAIGNSDGGNGGPECNPSSPNADCDNDQVLNKCDTDNPNYAGFDCDGDGIPNGQENDGCVNDPDPTCGETGGGDPQFTCSFTTAGDCMTWDFDQSEGSLNILGGYDILFGDIIVGILSIDTDANGDVIVDVGMVFGYLIDDLGVIIDDGTEECMPDIGSTGETLTFLGDYGAQTNVQVYINICPAN